METPNQEPIKSDKYRYDLASAVAGATVGAVAIAGVGTATFFKEDYHLRHAAIGGLSALTVYGACVGGSLIGSAQNRERALIPFETQIDRGIIIERMNGTGVPYVEVRGEDGSLKYVLFNELRNKALNSRLEENTSGLKNISADYAARISEIYKTTTPKSEKQTSAKIS